MLDPNLLRDHLAKVEEQLKDRGADLGQELKRLRRLDAKRREIIPLLENARRLRKEMGEQIARAKQSGEQFDHLLSTGQVYSSQIDEKGKELEKVERKRREILLKLPNLPHVSVPEGKNEADNKEVRRHGDPRRFDFQPKAHWDLGKMLGILDFERAAKLAGTRFAVLVGNGARLSRALINFMLELHTHEHGYVEIEPPFLANAPSLLATGNLPKFETELFKIASDQNLYLIPTGEVPLVNLHRDEILDGRRLPLNYAAYTPCFRSEAGSYGADIRGLTRQHQFDKVELVKYTDPDQSYDQLEILTEHAEEVLKRLELPYRTVVLSAGDMGFAAAKTYDLEVWLPAQETYREISSCSNTEAFQARRANIKYRRDGIGKAELVHTLNGSGLAVGRTLIAILENYQCRDGSVVIPEALRPFMNGLAVMERDT